MNLGTLTMIIAVSIVTVVASDGHQRIVIDAGGGSAIIASIWISIGSMRMATGTKLAAPRCQATSVFAPVALKSAVGIRMSIISGTLQSRSQQLWMRRLRPLCDPKLDTEVAEESAQEPRSLNPIGKGKPSRVLTRRGRFRRVVRLRLARRQLPPKPLLPRRRLSPKPLLPPSWEELF